MKTIVYIDAFNLYFGCLKHTSYKWLDVEALATRLSHEKNPDAEIVAIKYFTSRVNAKLSVRGVESVNAQRDYLLALESNCPLLKIFYGNFIVSESSFYPRVSNTLPSPLTGKVDVWRPEEKQTDVNIAVQMLCDAQDDRCQQQILITNDSDMCPLLEALRERYPSIVQGLVSPLKPNTGHPSASLKKVVNWLREAISADELAAAQLPPWVLTRKRKINKPKYW